MPKPYSKDLRERIVRALAASKSYDQVAEEFNVGRATVGRYARRLRERGDLEPDPMGGARNIKLDDEALGVLKELVEEQPDRTLEELTDKLEERTGTRVALSTVVRRLAELGMTRKKKSVVASERDSDRVQELRRVFAEKQAGLSTERLVFIDETGTHIGMTRRYGRGPKGERVPDTAPRNYGEIVTVIGALSISGLEAVMTVNGGTSADVFLAFVEEVLVDAIFPGDIVILDNLSAHKEARVREAVKGLGARLVFLPPYSPDLNPIESAWSKLKEFLRSFKARSRDALDEAIAKAADLISPVECAGWFEDCGYPISI